MSVMSGWRHLGQEKPKSMADLMTLMTCFCAGEDSWLAHSNNTASNPGTSEARDSNGKPRRNKHKRHKNGYNTEDTTVNAGFRGSKSSQRKKPLQKNNSGPSDLDRILDRPSNSWYPKNGSQSYQQRMLGLQTSRQVRCQKQGERVSKR